jgi:ketosteroid isomerase-like protein
VRDVQDADGYDPPLNGPVYVKLVQFAYEAWNQRDAERLVELTHADVEIAPLVVGVTSAGPWHGHEGVAKLLNDVDSHWDRFDIECEDVVVFGGRAVALVHVAVAAHARGPTITGDIAHLIEFEGDLVKRFIAYRDRAEAVAAAESEPE